MTDEGLNKQNKIMLMLEILLEQGEISWLQRGRGRANWLRHGGLNTDFQ